MKKDLEALRAKEKQDHIDNEKLAKKQAKLYVSGLQATIQKQKKQLIA